MRRHPERSRFSGGARDLPYTSIRAMPAAGCPTFSRWVPHFLARVPHFLARVPHFLARVPHFSPLLREVGRVKSFTDR